MAYYFVETLPGFNALSKKLRMALQTLKLLSLNELLIEQPVDRNDYNDAQNRSVDQLIIFRQPIWKVNIKIIFCRIGILPGNNG